MFWMQFCSHKIIEFLINYKTGLTFFFQKKYVSVYIQIQIMRGTISQRTDIRNLGLSRRIITNRSRINDSFYYGYNDEFGGDGWLANAGKSIFNAGKKTVNWALDNRESIEKGAKMASDMYGSQQAKDFMNMLPDNDINSRAGYAGEKHAIMKLPNGKWGSANFMGPNTQVMKRLKRGDNGLTPADEVAKRHDIDYSLASGMKDKQKQLKAVREADERMVKSLNRIANNKSDSTVNIEMGRRLIQSKMLAENAGLLDKSAFAGSLTNVSDSDRVQLMSSRANMTMKGYGYPHENLKKQIMKNLNKSNKKGNGVFAKIGMHLKATKKCKNDPNRESCYKKEYKKLEREKFRQEMKRTGVDKKIKDYLSMKQGNGLNLAGRGCCNQEGGFIIASLTALVASISAALATTTGTAIATAVAMPVAVATGNRIARAIEGNGLHGNGLHTKAKNIIHQKIKDIAIKPADLPANVIKVANDAIKKIKTLKNPTKAVKVALVDLVYPHVEKAFKKKVENKIAGSSNIISMAGSGKVKKEVMKLIL